MIFRYSQYELSGKGGETIFPVPGLRLLQIGHPLVVFKFAIANMSCIIWALSSSFRLNCFLACVVTL